MTDVLSKSEDYQSFRASIPLRKVVVDDITAKSWKVFDTGPRCIRCPVIFVPSICGAADVYFKQLLALSARGYRVISVESPPYWSVKEWCDGFRKLLDFFHLDKVHLFGASLGGFLTQKFVEFTHHSPRVASIILCNSFTDTSIFNLNESQNFYWLLPSVFLKRLILNGFSQHIVDRDIAHSIDFMVEKLEGLSQSDLASRLVLNCATSYVEPHKLATVPMTVIDVFDDYALSTEAQEYVYKCYPHAKLAQLKTGGNFPYLSRADEVNLHIIIHLRPFENTRHTACEFSQLPRREQRASFAIYEDCCEEVEDTDDWAHTPVNLSQDCCDSS